MGAAEGDGGGGAARGARGEGGARGEREAREGPCGTAKEEGQARTQRECLHTSQTEIAGLARHFTPANSLRPFVFTT